MIKQIIFFSLLVGFSSISAQEKFEPTWESLDSRNCPQWFPDAKFGIFIHWGIYSVPGYTNKGTYAEWYGHALNGDTTIMTEKNKIRHRVISSFHNNNYGEEFEYAEFKDDFTCEFFEPNDWAELFVRSGAKYVVLTSKHHDGYCLWPNKEASISFGYPWNSVETGPNRDLLGELTQAVRKTEVKMGLYYSIWDWFNPYWTEEMQISMKTGNMIDNNADDTEPNTIEKKIVIEAEAGLNKYIHKVMYPQFKELVENYQPSLIFSDGDWWMDDEKWQTKPLLAWLFNNAPNKNEVVINDRWGKVRGQHGGYYTTEYGAGFEGIEKPWEENRGIGMSFGINRIENIDDYRTEKELLFMLADLVSRGGNLLLNIGPNPDGTIPVIMQERLVQIGKWLDVNGEAIYGTRSWKQNSQWSDGEKPVFSKTDYHSGFPVFEMTIDPKPGNAVKEMWFTSKENNLYALTPGWPELESLIIKNIEVLETSKVYLLGYDKELPYTVNDKHIAVDLSEIGINDLPCNYIYSFKITDVK
jgi:alpha-L-fucosidase